MGCCWGHTPQLTATAHAYHTSTALYGWAPSQEEPRQRFWSIAPAVSNILQNQASRRNVTMMIHFTMTMRNGATQKGIARVGGTQD